MQKTKTIEQQYQILDELDHIRKRVSIYAGSPIKETRTEYISVNKGEDVLLTDVIYIPALIKVISEIIDNVVDEHKRKPEKVNTLKVTIANNQITVWDNGGIPVVIHEELGLYVPEIIFGILRSSSNYSDDEDQSLIGTNGLGCKLTSVLSKYFIVETADGSNYFRQEFSNGMKEKSIPVIKATDKNFTKLSFEPDLEYFKLAQFDEHHEAKVLRRLLDVSACNPSLKVYFNGQLLKVKNFKDYVGLYYPVYVYDRNADWEIGLASSSGYSQTSFVNSVETYMGGTHVDYCLNQIIAKLRIFFKKKHKVDVKPADIKSHLHVFINCNINRPKFSSQTKENMISLPADFGTAWECSDGFIKKILELEAIQNILDWVKAKEEAALKAEMRKNLKNLNKADPKNVPKFHDATSKNRKECVIFLVEGDSALSGILSGRDTKLHGAYPLRGKPINVYDMSPADVIENAEFKNLMNIIGLQLGEQITSLEELRFGKIILTTDQDLDGYSIRGLLMNAFYKYWKELFKLGAIHLLQTPIVKVKYKKQELSFYDLSEFEKWKELHKEEKYESKYYKGLGTSTSKEWKEYLSVNSLQENLMQLKIETEEDEKMFELIFSKAKGMTDRRKDWMGLV